MKAQVTREDIKRAIGTNGLNTPYTYIGNFGITESQMDKIILASKTHERKIVYGVIKGLQIMHVSDIDNVTDTLMKLLKK